MGWKEIKSFSYNENNDYEVSIWQQSESKRIDITIDNHDGETLDISYDKLKEIMELIKTEVEKL